MQTKIQKWGNSLAVRIPQAFVKEAHVAYGSAVELSVEDGKIVIAPLAGQEYRLDEMLKAVNKHNIHAEIGTGGAVGGEAC
jgi:antitoxin MazE